METWRLVAAFHGVTWEWRGVLGREICENSGADAWRLVRLA